MNDVTLMCLCENVSGFHEKTEKVIILNQTNLLHCANIERKLKFPKFRVKEAELSSSCVTGQYKKADESTSDNDRSKVNEKCGGKENVVNASVHGVSTGGSLFNLTGMQNTIKIQFFI